MTVSNIGLRVTFPLVLLAFGLTGCGGTKLLKEPEPIVAEQSLAAASDQHLEATLDWIIVRDGPGTWARNADWDEYLLRVANTGDEALQITGVAIVDSLGIRIDSRENRRQLVKGTKDTKRRYEGEGIEVRAGLSGTALVGAAVATAAGTSGLGAAALAGGGAAAGAAAVVVLTPVVAVGGIARGINNSKVNNEIISRQTRLPANLPAQGEMNLDMFFPLAPAPRKIEISYADSLGERVLVIDTEAALDGLHLTQAGE